jgi:hypothetical protein
MNLERVEELCLNYLGQASNPLVSINSLLEHCRRDAACAELAFADLKDFLEHHELVRVVEGPGAHASGDLEALLAAGVDVGPRAILLTRMPSSAEVVRHLEENLSSMVRALTAALDEAEKWEDAESAKQVRTALERAHALEQKFKKMF